MYLLQIEYPIADYDAWKAAFDADRLDRAGSGVRRYRILQPTDDPNYVVIDLEFDDLARPTHIWLRCSAPCIHRRKHLQPWAALRRRGSSRWWR